MTQQDFSAFVGTRAKCVRLARRLVAGGAPAPLYVVECYGFADEVWTKVDAHGDLSDVPPPWKS